jgi:hypothetical protein
MSASTGWGSRMRTTVLGLAYGGLSFAALQVSEWIHNVAGVAGDVGLILAVAGAGGVAARKGIRSGRQLIAGTRKAWGTLELVAEQTETVPEIASKLDRHIEETREQFARGSQRFASIEATLDAMAREASAVEERQTRVR